MSIYRGLRNLALPPARSDLIAYTFYTMKTFHIRGRYPLVSIVGRVNTGKSTLFNALIGKPLAIADDTPGLTRGGLRKTIHHNHFTFELLDTGGLFPPHEDDVFPHVRKHIEHAVQESDLILFLVDLKSGLTPYDEEIGRWLRTLSKDVILVANKADIKNPDPYPFFTLGFGEPILVSASHREGIEDLKDQIVAHLQTQGISPDIGKPSLQIRVALLGKPNTGKSSLLNRLAGREITVVSSIPGTTRDAVDVEVDDSVFVDTAGILRRYPDEASYWASLRSQSSIRFAEVAVVLLDLNQGITRVDRNILRMVIEEGRALVVGLSKSDLIPSKKRTPIFQEIRQTLSFVDFAPFLFVSAETGENVDYLKKIIRVVHHQWKRRIPHEDLVHTLDTLLSETTPPSRVYRYVQVKRKPPTIMLVVDQPWPDSFIKFVERRLRDQLGLMGTPLRFVQRKKTRRKVQR